MNCVFKLEWYFGNSSTVIGMMPSFSVSFGVLLECVVLIVGIRQLLSKASGLYGCMTLFLKLFLMVVKHIVLTNASIKIAVKLVLLIPSIIFKES